MSNNLIIFEDEKTSDLGSIALMKPVFDLLCGMTSLRDKLLKFYKKPNITFAIRKYLHDVYREQLAGEGIKAAITGLENVAGGGLFLNGRALVLSSSMPDIEGPNEVGYIEVSRKNKKSGEITEKYEDLVYLRTDGTKPEITGPVLSGKTASFRPVLEKAGYKVTKIEEGITTIRYPWDLIINNSEAIKKDFENLEKKNQFDGCNNGVFFVFLEKDNVQTALLFSEIKQRLENKTLSTKDLPVFIGEGSWIDPGVIIDITEGPVYIGKNVKITHPSRIAGPCYIGDKTVIDGAKLREGNSIGPVCKIAGEVEESIFQGYSNKHHDGFLGHSFVSEWVNIGALATNSDLKNTYGTVKVKLSPEKTVDSGEYKMVGSYIGAHTTIGIGTFLTTGIHIGVACNLFDEMPPKYVPSFSWGSGKNLTLYDVDKVLETADTVMSRRGKKPSDAYKTLLGYIKTLTEKKEFYRNN